MTRKIQSFFYLIFLSGLMYLPLNAQSPAESKIVKLQNNRYTVFDILSEISRQTSHYFIYDSELIDNSKSVTIRRGEYTLGELLGIMFADESVNIRYIDKYIVFYPKSDSAVEPTSSQPLTVANVTDSTALWVKGRIVDSSSGEPLSFASVVLHGRGKGISANEDGVFNIKILAEYQNDTLKISYLGYSTRFIPVKLLQNATTDIYMDIESRLLNEVTVRSFDPMHIISKAIEGKDELYPDEPTLHNSFYREGVFKNSDLLNYSEAIFEIYKSSYSGIGMDQVKVLKSRNISNDEIHDSVVIKLKAGIQGMLELDIVKNPPDFFDPLYLIEFQFPDAGIVNHDAGSAYAITFRPADYVDEGVYEGTIYIDAESMAVLQVDFGITPSYLAHHQNRFLLQRSKLHNTRIRSMNYSVRYAWHNGKYHIQHVRGEIVMRIRERNKLLGSNYNAFFEMAVMDIETEDVRRFSRRETIRPTVVFTDQNFAYDPEFWEDFNYVFPEQRITNAIQQFNIQRIEFSD